MSTAQVVELIGQDVTGVRAQVRTRYDWPDWQPAWRTLRKVERKVTKGVEWVYLRWEPSSQNEMGYTDCGYSGKTLDIAGDWTIELEDAD